MELLEKVLNCVIWLLIISGMMWFFYGMFQLVNLVYLRGNLW